MDKLYPNPKVFVNNSEPDLDAEYFNGVEQALSAIDERLANLLLNSLTATEAGKKALDAVVGKILNDKIVANANAIGTLNSNINTANDKISAAETNITAIQNGTNIIGLLTNLGDGETVEYLSAPGWYSCYNGVGAPQQGTRYVYHVEKINDEIFFQTAYPVFGLTGVVVSRSYIVGTGWTAWN